MEIQSINIKIIDRFENDRIMRVEHTQVGAPKLVYNGADDKYQPIMASEFSFNLMVNDKSDGKFFHLYTGNEKRYYVLVEDQDENMLFEGYLLPDFYEEPYDNGVIFINLTATDGIGLLKGHYLDDFYYLQETSVIKLIAECLKKTGLQKEIHFTPAIQSAATDYRWDEIAVNGLAYLEGDLGDGVYDILTGETDLRLPSRKSVYDILSILLKSIGCTLYGQGLNWYVEGINRKHEVTQYFEKYTYNGVFVETATEVKEITDITYFKTPVISIKSPWKRVNIKFDLDEDGELIPETAIKYDGILLNFGDVTFSLPNDNTRLPLSFWKVNGDISFGLGTKDLKFYVDWSLGWAGIPVPVGMPPFHIHVQKQFMTGLGTPAYDVDGETAAGTLVNFVSIAKRKYLKTSDEFIARELVFKMEVASISDGEEDVENHKLDHLFRYDLLTEQTVGDDVGEYLITSSRPEIPFETRNDFEMDYVQGSGLTAITTAPSPGIFTVIRNHVSGKIDQDYLPIVKNGFFDLKLMGPVSVDPEEPDVVNYVVRTLSVNYTEQKEWVSELERNIDFTTVYDLEFFHGDSIQDLSIKQFRFRRIIPAPETVTGEINIISSFVQSGFIDSWVFVISYEHAQLILNNHQILFWNLPMPYGIVNVDQLEANPSTGASNYGIRWGVSEVGGVWMLSLVPTPHMETIGFSVFQASLLYVDISGEGSITYGLVAEDNEWRESWKRYGVEEDIRYGYALGRVYHDVQPEAVVCVEGSAIGTIFPREICRFLWMDLKNFIPTRIEIDFTNGRTNLFSMEDKYSNINDYVN